MTADGASLTILEAFHLSALGTRDDLKRAMVGAPTAPATLLKALIAQSNGDVEGALRVLRRLVATLRGADRAAVADVLAPLLVMRHQNDDVIVLARIMQEGGWKPSSHAFLALAYADIGDRDAAKRHLTRAEHLLSREGDDVIRGRVLQRLARAAYYLHMHERSLNLTLASATLNSELGAWRLTAASYSLAYSLYHNVTGDIYEADRYARLWHQAASKSEDESLIRPALVAEFCLAVQMGDDDRTAILRQELRRKHLPELYAERYPLALSEALLQGAQDLRKMRTLLLVLSEYPNLSRGTWALCMALVAVSEAAEGEDESAKRSIREAIARLGRPKSSDPAYEQQYRRMARVAAAVARVLMGDEALAMRTMETRESLRGAGEELLPALMQTRTLSEARPDFRAFARVFAKAWDRRSAHVPPADLTRAEFEILCLYAKGWSAGRIARETERSINTVYSHAQSILGKFEASRVAEAVAIARDRGLLP